MGDKISKCELEKSDALLLDKLFYSVKKAAYLLDLSDKTIRRLLERDILKTSLATRKKQITRQSILDYYKATT